MNNYLYYHDVKTEKKKTNNIYKKTHTQLLINITYDIVFLISRLKVASVSDFLTLSVSSKVIPCTRGIISKRS